MASLPRHEFDRSYIDRLIAEDPETERHFTRYFGDLLSLKLRSRLRSPALVEDARQETFLRVLTTLKQKNGLETPGSLGAFVNSVCNNVLFELYRSEGRATQMDEDRDVSDDGASGVEMSMLAGEERDQVRRALAGLPDRERNLIRWIFFEERNKDEVCRELNIDRNYLRVLLHRAKTRFREQYSGEGPR